MNALIIFTFIIITWYIRNFTNDDNIRSIMSISTKSLLAYMFLFDITIYDYVNNTTITLLTYPYTLMVTIMIIVSAIYDIVKLVERGK